jgi:putative ABC transport system permease protein
MKNKTYLKASLREIKQSKGRFIAIVLIIFLGTFLYVGVKATGPVLNHSASSYVNEHNLADMQVTSTLGITDQDIETAEAQGIQVEAAYQFYYATKSNEVVQLISYSKEQEQNTLILKEGRLPKSSTEIVLDTEAKQYGYQLDDTYSIDASDTIKDKNFKIVGFVDSPLFISKAERGYANVGSGTVTYFAYLPENQFLAEVQSVLYLSFDNVKNLETYSDAYQDEMDKNQEKVETLFSHRPQERIAEIKQDAQEELKPAKEELATGKTQLADAQAQLDVAKEQLEQQKSATSLLPSQQQASALAQLSEAEATLSEQQTQINEEKEKLADAETTLQEKEQEINEIEEPTYLFNLRKDNPGFQEYGGLSDRIAAIANVFPVFFFFIAALITFTTMTRMVEENRKEIGTLKALGYAKREIARKYIIYALLSSTLGILFGAVLGIEFLPRLIYFLSNERYILGGVRVYYVWGPIIQATIAFILATLGAALVVLYRDLREKPAQLLQARAPKPGKRIFLEYIKPLWGRLSFNQKISYRNIFRYKSRMIMAIIGIAGCAGLMVAGVGLKDSLGSVSQKQFGPITDYQAIVTLTDGQAENTEVFEALDKDPSVKQSLLILNETIELHSKEQGKQSLSLMVPSDNNDFSNYMHLHSVNGNKLSLDAGAVITMKYAELFDVQVGDELTFYDKDQTAVTVKVAGIAENYLGNSLYLSRKDYEEATNKTYQPTSLLLKTKNMNQKQEDVLSKELLETDQVQNTTFLSTQINAQDESMGNLNSIVLILVVLSGALAFVVLYNLTNINVSERIRELSTIKVLGFYDKEVTMYIVRENVVFTLLGILAGYGVGYFLTDFILRQASMENMVFPLVISWQAYALAGGMTIVFTIIVMLVTHYKLKHVNMIDALKSNE